MDDDECAICLSEFRDTIALLPCAHKFCSQCFYSSIKIVFSCPLCRAVPIGIRSSEDHAPSLPCKSVVCMVQPDEHGGITLSNSKFGVKIKRLNHRDVAKRAGLRVNDVITHINRLRCIEHAMACAMWDEAARLSVTTATPIRFECTVIDETPPRGHVREKACAVM